MITFRRITRIAAIAVAGVALTTGPVALLLGSSNEKDGFRILLGANQDELVRRGKLEYPEEGTGHNHACHRLAARITTERFGPVVALSGGIANELAETTSMALMGQNPLSHTNISETWGDLGANWRGVKDAFVRIRG